MRIFGLEIISAKKWKTLVDYINKIVDDPELKKQMRQRDEYIKKLELEIQFYKYKVQTLEEEMKSDFIEKMEKSNILPLS